MLSTSTSHSPSSHAPINTKDPPSCSPSLVAPPSDPNGGYTVVNRRGKAGKHGPNPGSSQTQLTFAPTAIATSAASSLTVSGDIVEVGETHAARTAANPHATTSTTARAPASAAQHATTTDCKEYLEGNSLPSSSS